MLGRAGRSLLVPALVVVPAWGAGHDNRVQSGSGRPGELDAVAVVSASDVWAVGSRQTATFGPVAAAQHWDGQRWRSVPVPHPGEDSFLEAVGGASANDVWAGGGFYGAKSGGHTLLMHWDGTAWTKTSFPGSGLHDIHAISAVAPDDVWVTGTDFHAEFAEGRGFVGHWDGTTWTVQQLAGPGRRLALSSIDARSVDDVWVVGWYSPKRPGTHLIPVTEHWDGTAWTTEATPGPDPHQNYLWDIDASPSGQAWTVGEYGGDGGGGFRDGPSIQDVRTLADQWNGSSWSQSQTIDPSPESSTMQGVAAVADDDVWAVGSQEINSNPLIEHWDGTAWSVVDSPKLDDGRLTAIDAASATDIWAVGEYNGVDNGLTLVLHWDGTAWSKV
jgi:hypothetical protein